ncbi:sodium/proline symporter [Butyrivibrio sp. NC3005]|uniref:sodium/proline symporter n=1 Tax=Butyrivibrio sp. NC3005 TaxID=1280685 RepID=UPI00041C1FE5|nr:sodium/proline symporter [Butyrivibrio sp. NC3005]
MTTAQIGIIISILVYLAMMLMVGFVSSRDTNDVKDFYLGGRKLGPFVTAMSAEASDMSSYLLMGVPGLAYLTGIADAGWTAVGLIVGTYLNWLFVAKRLRNYTEKLDAITIPDFFKKRFRDDSNIILCIGALFILVFFVPYTASGFSACGKLFSSLFGVNYQLAMIVSAVIIVGYTTTGGFLAASKTDFIQSIVMSFALLFVLGYGISSAKGMEAVFSNTDALPGFLNLSATFDNVANSAAPYGFFSKVTTFCWGLGYFGMPHILLRFMAVRKSSDLKLSRRIASVWVVVSLGIAVFLGVVGRAMTQVGVLNSLVDADNPSSASKAETLIVILAQQISERGFLFALVAGLVLAGILASTMSTADSQLIAASSSVSENIIQETFGIKLSETAAMLVARATLIAVAIFGVVIAWDPNSSVFGIVSFAWAGFGAVFGPIMILSLYWRRANKYGAMAGMVSGGVMVFVWKYLVRPLGGVWNLYELAPAFLVAIIVIIVVSLLTKEPEKEIVDAFDHVKMMS